jgi:hypothetical protein
MAAPLYDYVDEQGRNPITTWMSSLQKRQLAKVNMKLQSLEQNGDQILPGFVTPAVGSGHIKEIKISGDVAIRLLLCRGPIRVGREPQEGGQERSSRDSNRSAPYTAPEYTLLLGAEERDNKYVPSDAVSQAEERRQIILKDNKRRVLHVHVGP